MTTNLDPTLLATLGRVEFRPPASNAAVSELESSITTPLPGDYLAFLRSANGAEGWIGENYVQISACDEAIETTRALGEFVPGLFFFGGDGAAALFAFDLRQEGRPVVITHTDDLDFDGLVHIAASFTDFVLLLDGHDWVEIWSAAYASKR